MNLGPTRQRLFIVISDFLTTFFGSLGKGYHAKAMEMESLQHWEIGCVYIYIYLCIYINIYICI